jgi:hypothetical protein
MESVTRRLDLGGIDAAHFASIVDLGCGKSITIPGGIPDAMRIATAADRFQMDLVCEAIEDEILKTLTLDSCADLLTGAIACGLPRIEKSARLLALDRFEAFAATPGFLALPQHALASLLPDDALRADREERVFESLVRWMRANSAAVIPAAGISAAAAAAAAAADPPASADAATTTAAAGRMAGEELLRESGAGEMAGEELLRMIRFPLMDAEYLAEQVPPPPEQNSPVSVNNGQMLAK